MRQRFFNGPTRNIFKKCSCNLNIKKLNYNLILDICLFSLYLSLNPWQRRYLWESLSEIWYNLLLKYFKISIFLTTSLKTESSEKVMKKVVWRINLNSFIYVFLEKDTIANFFWNANVTTCGTQWDSKPRNKTYIRQHINFWKDIFFK